MNDQLSIRLSEKMLTHAKVYADEHGYDTVQDLIRELLREKLFPDAEESCDSKEE